MGKQPRAPQTQTRRRRAPLTPPQKRCPRTPPPLAPPPQAVAPVPKMQPPPNVPPGAWAGAWAPGGWTWSQELAPRPAPAQDGAWSLGPRPQPPPRVVPPRPRAQQAPQPPPRVVPPRPRAPQAPQPLRPPGLQPQAPPQALLRARPKTPTAPTAMAWKSLPEGPPPPKMRPMQPMLDPPPHLLVPKFAALPHGKVEAIAFERWGRAKLRREKKLEKMQATGGAASSRSRGAASSGEGPDEAAIKCIERILSERMDVINMEVKEDSEAVDEIKMEMMEVKDEDSEAVDEIKMEFKDEESEVVEWSAQQLAALNFARAQLICSGAYGSSNLKVECDSAIEELEEFLSSSSRR